MTLPTLTATLWDYPIPEGFHEHSQAWKCTFTYRSSNCGRPKQWTMPFFMGPACTNEPTSAEVLDCLFSDDQAGQETFESFCAEFGYDTDSRRAYSTWEKCKETSVKLRRFLGADFDAIAEEVRQANG